MIEYLIVIGISFCAGYLSYRFIGLCDDVKETLNILKEEHKYSSSVVNKRKYDG